MSSDTKNLPPSADTLHTCSYACERPGCIRAQRDYLAAKLEALTADQFIATFRCESGEIVGTTEAKIHSVTRHDDGRIEVVIDHWPEQPAVVDEAMVVRACRHWYDHWDEADPASKRFWAKTMRDLLTAALSGQQRAAHPASTHCDNCGCDWLDNGLNPIGCPYCKQNAWRAAFISERTMRYIEGGMAIEQARIHAETETAFISKQFTNKEAPDND
jgi:hypothetical protein